MIGAYITHDRRNGADRLVSEFIAEFDGLTGSAKRAKVLDDTGLKRAKLSELVVDDKLDGKRIEALLGAMQMHTRPVKPRRLGIIGEEHLRKHLLAMGVVENSFRYVKKLKLEEGLPCVQEVAFGWRGDDADDDRSIFAGVNWSVAIKNPFRSFGASGEGLEALLSNLQAGANEPIVYAIHIGHPRVEYTDRGKSALVIGGATT